MSKIETVKIQQPLDMTLDQCASLLSHIRGKGRKVGGSCVILFIITGRRRGVLHHHKPYGRLLLWGRGLRRVFFRRVFATTVVQNARDEKDQEQDHVAGDEDDKV